MNNDTVLKDIVPKAYARNRDNIRKIISFVRKLSYCKQDAIAYPVLYNQMEDQGHLNSPYVLAFSQAIQTCSNHIQAQSPTLKNKLDNALNSLVETWGGNIRSGNYETIKAYAKDYWADFWPYLEEIVKTAYNRDIYNAEKVIAFIDTLPYFRDQVIGYPALFDAMTSSNGFKGHELIMLAYRAKQRMSNMGYTASDAEKQRLLAIKNRLPSGIRTLLWDSYVYIKSRKHSNNYLGQVATECPIVCLNIMTCPSSEKAFKIRWTVSIYEAGRYFSFKLDSTNSDFHGRYNRHDSLWEVIPVESGNYFYFKSKSDSKVLDANNLKSGWNAFWKGGASDCSESYLYDYYTGNSYQQWEIT